MAEAMESDSVGTKDDDDNNTVRDREKHVKPQNSSSGNVVLLSHVKLADYSVGDGQCAVDSMERSDLKSQCIKDELPISCSTPFISNVVVNQSVDSGGNISSSDFHDMSGLDLSIGTRKLKKDDSGVGDLERSPTGTKDTSLFSDGESLSETCLTDRDSGAGSRANSISLSDHSKSEEGHCESGPDVNSGANTNKNLADNCERNPICDSGVTGLQDEPHLMDCLDSDSFAINIIEPVDQSFDNKTQNSANNTVCVSKDLAVTDEQCVSQSTGVTVPLDKQRVCESKAERDNNTCIIMQDSDITQSNRIPDNPKESSECEMSEVVTSETVIKKADDVASDIGISVSEVADVAGTGMEIGGDLDLDSAERGAVEEMAEERSSDSPAGAAAPVAGQPERVTMSTLAERLRRRLQRRRRSSNSSTDSEGNLRMSRPVTGDDDESGASGDDEDSRTKLSSDSDPDDQSPELDPDPAKRPKQTWHAIPELYGREIGSSGRYSMDLFQQRATGSLRFVQRFEPQSRLDYHRGCVNALNFNRIGTLLASGSDDLNVVLWNWIRNRPVLIFDSGHRGNVFQAKFMPYSGDQHIVTCSRDGQVRLAELSLTGVCKGTKKLAQHKAAAHKLALEWESPHIILSCAEDAVVFEIDLREDKPTRLVTTKENDRKISLFSIHSNPCNPYEFCVGCKDQYIRVYDKRKIAENENGGVYKKFCPHHLLAGDSKANVTCACYNYNGTEILGSYNDEDIYLFDNDHSDGANYIKKYQGHRNNATVKGVNFYGPKSEFIVSGSDCGNIFIWDKLTEKIVQYMKGDEGGVVNVLEPHPLAPVLATSGLDHDVKIWAPTASEPTKLKGLKKLTKKNQKDRTNDTSSESVEMLDRQMLWFLMHHLERRDRRRARQEGEDIPSSSSNDDSDTENNDDDDDDDDDDDEDNPARMLNRFECNQS